MNIDQTQMLPIGTLLQEGKYRVEHYMASGGFGNTYVVEHVKLGKHLALKEFFMRNINLRDGAQVTVSVSSNQATFQQMKEKFVKEAQRLAQLKENHIVGVSDFFEENETAYYVMDLIEGESLAARLKRTGMPLNEYEARQVLDQVLRALWYVHQQGLFHLDIKPGNIMQDNFGHCWLIDFGASKQLTAQESQTLSTSTGLCYTPGYAPSEQVSGNTKRIGPWTDFYALGATMYNLVTNLTPPEMDDVSYEGPAAFRFPPYVSPQMCQLIMWMMAPRHDQRPQDANAIGYWLNQPAQQPQYIPQQQPVSRPIQQPVSRPIQQPVSQPQYISQPIQPQPMPQPQQQPIQVPPPSTPSGDAPFVKLLFFIVAVIPIIGFLSFFLFKSKNPSLAKIYLYVSIGTTALFVLARMGR